MYFCGLFCLSEQKRSKGVIMLYTEIMNDNKDFLTLYKKGKYSGIVQNVILGDDLFEKQSPVYDATKQESGEAGDDIGA